MIQYVNGDATFPQGDDIKFIVHICNNVGYWNKGFVNAISKRWSKPRLEYINWFKQKTMKLGEIQIVHVESTTYVINVIGQHSIRTPTNRKPVRYDAIEKGLTKVALKAKEMNASIHMPRIGCGLGGGDWDTIEQIINRTLKDLNITVYDY